MKRRPREGKREIRMRHDDGMDRRTAAETGRRVWGELSGLGGRLVKRIKRVRCWQMEAPFTGMENKARGSYLREKYQEINRLDRLRMGEPPVPRCV